MYQHLNRITLKSGEVVQAGVVQGPDLDWAERVETLLGHKGPSWRWGNEQVLRTRDRPRRLLLFAAPRWRSLCKYNDH